MAGCRCAGYPRAGYGGHRTHYTYDEDGHCIAIRNDESENRHFLYDGCGLLIKETAPDDTLHYRYDAAGRLIRK
nr:hypothetical protein [Pectobacterium carotovorum]